ncbi:carbon-nitrogen hydrolase family protein [Terrimonas pollutisoli]|uniref:carbon-nitrogen hydrolase family protein n=1 Tax=Terrimonas pollutisoli TaxID=3034147 RepID=UPI0023ECA527|nr:carbon-nitrogen hydrolase family protein [Terrimonas sp. H1YJ31]
MKIAVAQIKPVKGDIASNINDHIKLIDLAVANSAGAIFFPELSITGYEPELAKELSTDKDDERFAIFQNISDEKAITIGVGVPLKAVGGVQIGMLIFQPHRPVQVYSKQYLHADEVPYFVPGHEAVVLTLDNKKIAPAICYELSVPEHPAAAHAAGANVYIASVAKTAAGMEKASETLAAIAEKYSMTVLIANAIGPCDNFLGTGKTSVWNNQGTLKAQLNDNSEGILILDTATGQITESYCNII